jgi:hypothetical protein
MKKLMIIAVSACYLVSCGTMSKSFTARTQQINKGEIVQNPLLADLDVKDIKVSGTATGKSIYREAVKQEAIANALKSSNADVLIEPSYEITTINDKITITVTGRPAVYKNFRTIKEEDIKLLKDLKTVNLETNKTKDGSQNAEQQTTKKNKGAKIAGIVALIALPLILISSGM